MTHFPKTLAILALSAAPLTSCATMMVGHSSTIEVTSDPTGATITSSTGLEATTPCDLVLPNGREVEITARHVAHPGDTRVLVSVPDTSRWAAGNVLFGGAAGLASDASNPGTRVHKKDIHFDFTKTAEELKAIEAAKEAAAAAAKRRSGGTM